MIVSSRRGPLNCNEYDSALLTIELNAPVAGSALGLIQASTETRAVGDSAVFDAICTREFVPESVTALSAAFASRPGTPSVAPAYVPEPDVATLFAAVVPDVSSRRQYPTGASAMTVCA